MAGCTITRHVNLVINRSIKLGRAEGALEEVNNVIDTIFSPRNNIKPHGNDKNNTGNNENNTGKDKNNTSPGTSRTATRTEENFKTTKATNSTTTKDKHISRGREGVKKRTT